ncbi:hypothetical protein P171DRAFT_427084 [Karstenula rhodostoma CBS 690.94]|uniref:Uncharacterized protein n=1 Tax=Karstenula rhodostoma CBS 690.94 TaxID=1392251 RepID=A0A9P4UHL8_9PLEO|nr:hypothetical protein P171DRAFT_427084 [Karstenula rhodostoma CBS 690.94]
MVFTPPFSNSTAFLALPLNICQQVYWFCILENLCFICSDSMDQQNRLEGWVEPLWCLDSSLDGHNTSGADSSFVENDCLHSEWESVEVFSGDGEDSNA